MENILVWQRDHSLKVTRDRLMDKDHKNILEYGFDKQKAMEQKLIMRLLKNMEFVLCIENLLDY
jgi:hypothetical protein